MKYTNDSDPDPGDPTRPDPDPGDLTRPDPTGSGSVTLLKCPLSYTAGTL